MRMRRIVMIEIFKKWIWKIISGIIGAIQTVLIVLRFFGRIGCSWWMVFSPILITFVLILIYSIMKLIFRRKK